MSITNKFEIDVLNNDANPARASEFAIRNNCPAIVVNQEHVAPFIVDRASKNGLYKIITVVDFSAGRNFAMQKFRDLNADAMAADGFDIMVIPHRTHLEAQNEIRSITEFVKRANVLAEVRWIFNIAKYKISDYQGHINAIKSYPCDFIRLWNDGSAKLSVDDYKSAIKTIHQSVVSPIKVSGEKVFIDEFRGERTWRFDTTVNMAAQAVKRQLDGPDIKANNQKTTESIGDTEVIGTLGQDVK